MLKKIAAVFLSVLLLAAGTGLLTAQNANAAGDLTVIVNGQALQLDGSSAYTNGSGIMLPLRETAEALKYKVTFAGNTGTFQLDRFQEKVEFSLAGQSAILDGKNKVPYSGSIELKQKRAYAPLSLFAAMGLVTSYDPKSGHIDLYLPEVTAGVVAGMLASGNYEALRERYFNAQAEPQLSLPVLQQSWESVTAPAGNYLGVKSTEIRQQAGIMTLVSVLSFSKSEALMTLELDASGNITKLNLAQLLAAPVLASPQK